MSVSTPPVTIAAPSAPTSRFRRGCSPPPTPTTRCASRGRTASRSPRAGCAELAAQANAGRLDSNAVTAVVEAAGLRAPRVERPAGLTERETEVVGMLARGLQTKQVARALGISAKTADRHIQNAYGKIGVSTRAAATLFAMEHGLVAWGELPISRPRARS